MTISDEMMDPEVGGELTEVETIATNALHGLSDSVATDFIVWDTVTLRNIWSH